MNEIKRFNIINYDIDFNSEIIIKIKIIKRKERVCVCKGADTYHTFINARFSV